MATLNKCINIESNCTSSSLANSLTQNSENSTFNIQDLTSQEPGKVNGASQSHSQSQSQTQTSQSSLLPSPLSSSSVVTLDERLCKDIKSVIPKKRQDALKWYGWGYKDSEFYVKDYMIHFRGDRYPLKDTVLPLFTEWVLAKFNCTLHNDLDQREVPTEYPQPTVNHKFLEELKTSGISYSVEGMDRLFRCHGQTMHDIYYLCNNKFKRIPDVVTWPLCHNDVVKLVDMAHRHDVVVLPYGGGTSVSGATTCPQNEPRMICSLDTSQMNRMLWLNKSNLTVCFEAGIVGQDLERTMRELGLTVGHEPDSYEFSTLGGWVATRASGMKKNLYGNIEDLVVRVKMVTPSGVLERQSSAPRVSCGPDFNHIIMGSEGTLGVITEVVLKVRPLPPVRRYNSVVFPDFDSGVKFMREVAERRCQPSSVRLMDNEQFIFGQSLKPPKGFKDSIIDFLKTKYVTTIKGIDLQQICAATLLFEGELCDVDRQEQLIISIAKKYNGFAGGGQNGERGYILTFVIAYIRDLGLLHDIIAESFETSVPWDRCAVLCENVKRRVKLECHAKSVMYYTISCRVTQTYDAGACIYFYFGFNFKGFDKPLDLFECIEAAAREEILACGGSISHHHGIGKVRSRWYQKTVTKTGTELYKATKHQLDPKNIFATGNILPSEELSTSSGNGESQRTHNLVQSKL